MVGGSGAVSKVFAVICASVGEVSRSAELAGSSHFIWVHDGSITVRFVFPQRCVPI